MNQPARTENHNPNKFSLTELKALATDDSVSPGMRQFFGLKAKNPDYLLFYRMGDFYELFFDDALVAAELLDISLTKRGKVHGNDIPMCGVPAHSSDAYLERLIAKGQKVAICEQLEDPAEAKKRGSKSVVHRDVVRIVTAGTLTEDSLLAASQSNYLTCYVDISGSASLAWVDISTGEFGVMDSSKDQLATDLARLSPQEILLDDKTYQNGIADKLTDYQDELTFIPTSSVNAKRAESRLMGYYGLSALDSWGAMTSSDLAACAALVDYIELTQKGTPPRLDAPCKQSNNGAMVIDAATRRNLEMICTLSGEKRGSLLHVIDRTKTASGGRMMTSWLCNPLTDETAINERLSCVQLLHADNSLRDSLREYLQQCPDMERSLSRLCMERGGARDMQSIGRGLSAASSLRLKLLVISNDDSVNFPSNLLDIQNNLGQHSEISDRLEQALKDDLPLLIRDGGFVKDGYHPALDQFLQLKNDTKKHIAEMQSELAKRSNIPTLKIKHNNVLGYFIELTALHADKAPEDFIHRQTMKGAMRFATPELAETEQKISEASSKALALELGIFDELLADIQSYSDNIIAASRAVAALDSYCSLAELAVEKNYNCPKVDDSLSFDIKSARHPVVESVMQKTSSENFVSNDCDLSDEQRLWLLTGPNMAGKSTFLRQNALIAIMAQMGGFVPAESAHIGVVDRLFSRVGAADDLARGRSTFMVEMVETATILSQSTARSLVILDEIGRGTATFDGLSIAWAVVEHLHNKINCRGLFATHYHELTQLTDTLPSLACYHMRVREWKGDVIFLHQVKSGSADRSYGIHVAKIAGLPPQVIARANSILKTLESEKHSPTNSLSNNVLPLFSYVEDNDYKDVEILECAEPDSEIFNQNPIIEELTNINPDELTPRTALDILYKLKKMT